jgi:hypothetical protein
MGKWVGVGQQHEQGAAFCRGALVDGLLSLGSHIMCHEGASR